MLWCLFYIFFKDSLYLIIEYYTTLGDELCRFSVCVCVISPPKHWPCQRSPPLTVPKRAVGLPTQSTVIPIQIKDKTHEETDLKTCPIQLSYIRTLRRPLRVLIDGFSTWIKWIALLLGYLPSLHLDFAQEVRLMDRVGELLEGI